MPEITTIIRPKVSVVIAVYNVENYIAQCCHSLFSQTLDNIEYIFVNDCSPDNSIAVAKSVLEEYPHRKHQVKIIEHSVNLGVSRTREDGVKAATGEYIIHCDSDDWIETNMYELLYEKAISEQAGMVMCDVYYHDPVTSRSYYGEARPKDLSSKSVLASCLHAQQPLLHGSLSNKLIKAVYYENVKWYENISFAEDLIACVQILKQPIKISYIPQALYYYRRREGTLTHRKFTRKDIENDYEVIEILHQILCNSGDTELYKYWQASIAWFMGFAIQSRERIYTNKEYLDKYRKYRNCILKNRSIAKSARYYLYSTTFNYVIPFTLLQWYRCIKCRIKTK